MACTAIGPAWYKGMSLAEMRSPASYLENEDCEAPAAHKTTSLTRSRRVETGALVVSGACMAGFATLALLGAYVP